jgi:hypothetical protein
LDGRMDNNIIAIADGLDFQAAQMERAAKALRSNASFLRSYGRHPQTNARVPLPPLQSVTPDTSPTVGATEASPLVREVRAGTAKSRAAARTK